MTERLLNELRREMKKRKAFCCVYGFNTPEGEKIISDAKSARYFSSVDAYSKWAGLIGLLDVTIRTLYTR